MTLADLFFEIRPAVLLHILPVLFVFRVNNYRGVAALDDEVGNECLLGPR